MDGTFFTSARRPRPGDRGRRWADPASGTLLTRLIVYTLALALAVPFLSAAGLGELLSDPMYLAVGAALLVGALIAVPWKSSGGPSSLLIVPLVAAQWRYAGAVTPLVAVATAGASIVRRASPVATLQATVQDTVSFLLANLAAESVDAPQLRVVVFAVTFAALRYGLWSAAYRYGLPIATDPHVEQPDLSLSIALAPLGALVILAGQVLGDGGTVLALAGLLPVLCIVSEWARLRVARGQAEVERARLEQARQLQDELTHLITHEVRNPLTTVLGYSQLARAEIDKNPGEHPNISRHLERIHRAGSTIERLTENLLQLSKVEGAEGVAASEPVDLGAVAREVAAELEPLAEQKQQHIELELPDSPPVAWASPMLLREALSNLVSNAVKYTPEGGRVRVWAQPGPAPGIATIAVTDTGVGLSDADQSRLFSKFFRSEDPRVVRERGAGLGLALTHAIVDRMGGRILVDSKLNEGATFRMELRVATGEER